MTHAITHTDGTPSDLDLDALLGDLDLMSSADVIPGEMPPEEVIEPATLEIAPGVIEAAPALPDLSIEELLALEIAPEPEAPAQALTDEEANALSVDLSRAEAYAAQESEAEVSDEIEAAPGAIVEAKPERKKREKAAAAPKAPRVAKDISTLDPEHFQLYTAGVSDPEAMKAGLLTQRPKQVKIAEKFDNVIASLAAGRRPSTYVMACFAVLDARKEVLGSDLVAALGADYTIGTARSQAGQMMELFSVLGIADRAGQKLTLRSDSAFAAKLRALPAA